MGDLPTDAEILVSHEEYQAASGLLGRMRGFLPHRWPSWFAPRLVSFSPVPVRNFPRSFSLTKANDVHLVPTPGHSDGHLSVILETEEISYFFAGDASYTQHLMRNGVVDGVSLDVSSARRTLAQINRYVQQTPTIYLPSHDPHAAARLSAGQTVPMEYHLPIQAAQMQPKGISTL